MKHISKLILCLVGVAAIFMACNKVGPLAYYGNGTAPVLTSSVTAINPTSADSANVVLTLNWTNPKYATDSATQKFVIEVDSAGRNFEKAVAFEVKGPLSYSFTGGKLNNVLANFGFKAGQPFDMELRVTSSYANNNEQYKSNAVKVTMTPYLVPIKLHPSSTAALTLTLPQATSNAISFDWNASAYGSNTINYALQMDTAGGKFTNPQMFKYGTNLNASIIQNDLNTAIINAGVLGGSTKNMEFRVVSYLGTDYSNPLVYSDTVNINITTYAPVPPNLYIVGDATPGGWSNPVPPSQQFTKVDDYSYSITIGLTAGKSYLFLPVNGKWDHKYGGTSATGGTLLADGAVPGSNTPAPSVSGVYKIVVNFQTNTYTLTKIEVPSNLYIVGDATPGGWSNPVAVPDQQFSAIDNVTYAIVIHLEAGKSYLFLPVNGDWGHKYGGSDAGGGTLLADGAVPGSNTPAPATSGLYRIVVNFSTNTYTVSPYTGPDNLYIVGDATAGGWSNPVPTPSQQFTKVGNATFTITLPLNGGKSYLWLPVNGDWSHKYGGTNATGGDILADGAVPGSNTPAPSADGTYKITVDFVTGKYTVQ